MLLWVIFGIAPAYPRGTDGRWTPFGGSVLLFVLMFLLGWRVFGWPLVNG